MLRKASYFYNVTKFDLVTQLVEYRPFKARVESSSLSGVTQGLIEWKLPACLVYNQAKVDQWELSSVGSVALGLHPRGRGFESPSSHKN
jgi:hypothetical protein